MMPCIRANTEMEKKQIDSFPSFNFDQRKEILQKDGC